MLVTFHAYYYYTFIADDSFISFRYADRLLEGKGLSWNDGRPVEGYSNLLWILILAAVRKLTQSELWMIALALNYFFSLASLWLQLKIVAKLTYGNTAALLGSTLLFALSAPIAIWINGGLESPLVMLLLILSLCNIIPFIEPLHLRPESFLSPFKRLAKAGILLGLLALTRPDGILFTWAITLSLLISERPPNWAAINRSFRPLILLNTIVILFYAGQLMFRLYYYGEWVPNTALVKITFTGPRFSNGLSYILGILIPFIPIMILCIVIRHSTASRAILILYLVIITVALAYQTLIGGDIFPGYRHAVPLIPLFCILGGVALMDLQERFARKKTVYYVFFLALLVFTFTIQVKNERNSNARKERWEWQAMALGQTLQRGFAREQPTIATAAAGALPYYAGLPTLDMLGLNDYYLPRHPPPDFGMGYLGHELGDTKYYLQQSPDIILLCGLGLSYPYFRGERALFYDSSFKQQYERVKLYYNFSYILPLPYWQSGFRRQLMLDGYSYLFIKQFNGSTGIRINQQSEVVIPSYFLRNNRQPDVTTITYINKVGELVVSIPAHEKYFFDCHRLYNIINTDTSFIPTFTYLSYPKGSLHMHYRSNRLEIYNPGTGLVELKELRIKNKPIININNY
jgi:hypothetical protein